MIGSGARGLRDGRNAALNRPFGLCAVRPDGSVLAFTDCHNNALRIVYRADDPRSRSVHTVEGSGLLTPRGLCASDDGRYLFVCDAGHHRIRFAALPALTIMIDDGEKGLAAGAWVARNTDVFAFAGSGKKGWRDGPVSEASFNTPSGICECRDGSIIVADTGNHCVRSIQRSPQLGGTLTVVTIAGGGRSTLVTKPLAGHLDAVGKDALFRSPLAVVEGVSNELLVADTMNHCIRSIVRSKTSTEWMVRTVYGRPQRSGFKDGVASVALLNRPVALCLGPEDSLFVADSGNNCIRQICRNLSERYASIRTVELTEGIARPIRQEQTRSVSALDVLFIASDDASRKQRGSEFRGSIWFCNSKANAIEEVRFAETLPFCSQQALVAPVAPAKLSDLDSCTSSRSSGYQASRSSASSERHWSRKSHRDHMHTSEDTLWKHNMALRKENEMLRKLLERTFEEIDMVAKDMVRTRGTPGTKQFHAHESKSATNSMVMSTASQWRASFSSRRSPGFESGR